MEREQDYTVAITPQAERYYRDVLEYFCKHHSEDSADLKSTELLELAIGLESERTVYVTDFFPCESDETRIVKR